MDNIALLASTCGNAAAATAALVEKRFAQSRQELLEQRHQELLHKQRQLQEQYTRLQQLSKRPMSARGFLNDLKKTGSESNIVAKTNDTNIGQISSTTTNIANNNDNKTNSTTTVHGSLHNIANTGQSDKNFTNVPASDVPPPIASARKTFETDIL